MKKIVQNIKSGATELIDTPIPGVLPNHLLIKTKVSLISAGTERMLVEFGKANLVQKARLQPEKSRQVLDKIRTDGLITAIETVRSKLQQEIELGYSNVGVVSDIGVGVSEFRPGDRVVSNGHHAETVNVAKNLCARIPDNVDNDSAAFTVVAAIGLQGIRLANPTLGESIAVIGTGLIGLLCVQMLIAQGCRVLAIDVDQEKLVLASQFGAKTFCLKNNQDPIEAGMAFSNGVGVDAVMIATSTKSCNPMVHAARMSRKRGRIVLVGVTGLELNRDDFYKKELTFQVSCSYGPGRYDVEYEDSGHDYPIAYVRWTEQRNFEAVLSLMSNGSLNVKPLVSKRIQFEKASEAYRFLTNEKSALGILLEYKFNNEQADRDSIELFPKLTIQAGKAVVGFVGAGNYAAQTLIPAFANTSASLEALVSRSGTSSSIQGRRYRFTRVSSNTKNAIHDEKINTIVIATRHDSHADLVLDSLNSGKHVFVEKPLCLTFEQLADIEKAYALSNSILTVGFNRRFSPLTSKIKSLLDNTNSPSAMIMTVNAGAVPKEHWIQDQEIGGGRIVGEACHFVDLLCFLAGSEIESADITPMRSGGNDTATINLSFKNGSTGVIHYFSNGNRKYPKERLEIFNGGKILQLNNFKTLKAYGWPGFSNMKLWRQDKGQKQLVDHFVKAVETGSAPPIPVNEIFMTSRICLELANQ